MSLSSEQDLLHPVLLIDSIVELLHSAAAVMGRIQEQARGDGYEDMYCKGYASGVEFSKEKVEQMFEQWKARVWSDEMDAEDMRRAKESYK